MTSVGMHSSSFSVKSWGRFAKNTVYAVGHKGQSVLQSPADFKLNAMALSSMILVMGRVTVASFSAAKAQDTPDGKYRAEESIRTYIREIGGFMSSYGIILGTTHLLKAGMRLMWGIKNPSAVSYQLWDNIKAAARNRHNPNYRTPKPDWAAMLSKPEQFDVTAHERADTLLKAVNRVRGLFKKDEMTDRIKAVKVAYEWTPIAVAGGIAFYVGGMLLERFTRRHSSDVVDWINRQANANQPPDAESFTPPDYQDTAKKPATPADSSNKQNPFFGRAWV